MIKAKIYHFLHNKLRDSFASTKIKTMKNDFFPSIITRHPGASIPFEGVNSKLIQAGDQQIIFMEINVDLEIPPHQHEAQWGVVLEGEFDLTIDGTTTTYKKGDSYFIPRNVVHSAKVRKGYKDMTVFDQKDRYTSQKEV